ncbi:MAG: hypothetical protein Ct9H300mP11_18340 [Chloroflexota bacterium]|nr:MAG: hypothetical protein Ct9H300mP11_18340 [Chloroflexota bacterium]
MPDGSERMGYHGRSHGPGQSNPLIAQGRHTRKGKRFPSHPQRVFILPNYLHQKEDLLSLLTNPSPKNVEQQHNDEKITFSYWAKLKKCWKFRPRKGGRPGASLHMDYSLRPVQAPLEPMLPFGTFLRVYKLEKPVTVSYLPEYGGCTSWVKYYLKSS